MNFADDDPAVTTVFVDQRATKRRLRKARLVDGEYRDVLHMALLHPDLDTE